jgi:rare lipoprotein A
MRNSVNLSVFISLISFVAIATMRQKPLMFNEKSSCFDTVKAIDTLYFNIKMYREKANACYYHDKFNGKRTASGTVFNNKGYTCAHKTLPFGTQLKVTSIKTGKFVNVMVTDRGPFSKGKDIDLTKTAFMAIAPKSYGGHISVRIEIIKESSN